MAGENLPGLTDLMQDQDLQDIYHADNVPDAQKRAQQSIDLLSDSMMQKNSNTVAQTNKMLQQNLANNTQNMQTIQANRQIISQGRDKMGSLTKTPKLVKNIMGLFDPEWNEEYWKEKMAGAANEIEGAQVNMQNMQMLTSTAGQMIENQMKQDQLIYNVQTGRVNAALEYTKTLEDTRRNLFNEKLALQGEYRSESQYQMQVHEFNQREKDRGLLTMNDGAIAKIAGDPNGAGGYTQRQALEEQLRRKGLDAKARMDELSISVTEAQEDRQKKAAIRQTELDKREDINWEKQQQSYKLTTMEDAQLEQAVAAGKPVDGMTVYQMKDEQLRRQKWDLDVQSVNNAVEDGNLRLAETKKAVMLSGLNLGSLTVLSQMAEKGGGQTEFQGLTFTNRELTNAAAVALGEEKEMKKAQTAVDLSIATTGATISNTTTMLLNTSKAFGTVYPVKSLSDAHTMMIAKVDAAIKNGDVVSAQAYAEEGQKQMQAGIDRLVQRYPEPQRGLLSAQLEGLPISKQEAASYLGPTIANKQGVTDPRFSDVWDSVNMSARQQLQQDGNSTANMSEDQIMDMILNQKKVPKLDILIQSAFSDSGAVQKWQVKRNLTAIEFALQDLSKKMPQAFGGLSTSSFSRPNAQGGLEFNSDLLLQTLRTTYNQQLAAGKAEGQGKDTPGGQVPAMPYDQILLEYLGSPAFQSSQQDYWTASLTPDGTAMATMLYGDSPMNGFIGYVQKIQADSQNYAARMAQEQARFQQSLQGQNFDPLTGAQY